VLRRVLFVPFLYLGCSGPTESPTRRNPAPPKLAFTVQPGTAQGAQPINPAVRVAIQDSAGNGMTSATDPVTVSLIAIRGAGRLAGTTSVPAASGVATFTDLSIDRPGRYLLEAKAPGMQTSQSATFAVQLTFVTISSGDSHTCGVTITGAAYCWGFNGSGRLGDDTAYVWRSPGPVAGGISFASVSAGADHSCGVTPGGVAYCWGANAYGQLGDGTNAMHTRPTPVSGGQIFADVSAGAEHTCGLTTGGAVYCWGRNRYGTLGDSSITDRSAPTPVSGVLTFSAVSAGVDHTCGVTTGGAAYCWGRNLFGRLGDSTDTDRLSPTLVAGGLSFTAVTSGGFHTCGLTSSGAAYCWGSTGWGQLGDGHYGGATNQWAPVPVSGGLSFLAVTAAAFHSCGLATDNTVYCWGSNGFGQIGDGSGFDRLAPFPVSGALRFATLDGGWMHTCARQTDGAVYCWGYSGNGQVGSGTESTTSPVPVQVVQ